MRSWDIVFIMIETCCRHVQHVLMVLLRGRTMSYLQIVAVTSSDWTIAVTWHCTVCTVWNMLVMWSWSSEQTVIQQSAHHLDGCRAVAMIFILRGYPSLPLPFSPLLSCPFLPLPFPPALSFPLPSHMIQPEDLGERCKLSQTFLAEPSWQTIFGEFRA